MISRKSIKLLIRLFGPQIKTTIRLIPLLAFDLAKPSVDCSTNQTTKPTKPNQTNLTKPNYSWIASDRAVKQYRCFVYTMYAAAAAATAVATTKYRKRNVYICASQPDVEGQTLDVNFFIL